jgi:2-polyprenyl-3-methyl-5-hydroxy-6-metoxy-1,4-benzoquinol methylase
MNNDKKGKEVMKEETVVVNDNTSDTKANKEISNKTINKNNKIENKSIENLSYIYLEIIPVNEDEEVSDRMKGVYTRLLKMLYKHCKGTMNGYKKRVIHDLLVPKILYQDTYYALKQKYGKYWVENWPEETDPQKHVFEDIGIATWLKLLWKDDKEKISFIDIGCGNGLLTNLLTKEGFKGYGIDISKRKVWDIYDKDVKLEERFISPQTQTFEDGTWLIGNHPDEMTLWIPIMASKSGYNSKFVIIPCCFFELTGSKFSGKGYNIKKNGRYHCYLDRVRKLMTDCGYVVEEERLRIPSTKNIALVGRKRTFREDDEEEYNRIKKRIKAYIDEVEASGEFKLRIPDDEKQRQLLAKRLARKTH